jgi:hypothetical protein
MAFLIIIIVLSFLLIFWSFALSLFLVLLSLLKSSAVLSVYSIRVPFKCTVFNAIIFLFFLFFASEVVV